MILIEKTLVVNKNIIQTKYIHTKEYRHLIQHFLLEKNLLAERGRAYNFLRIPLRIGRFRNQNLKNLCLIEGIYLGSFNQVFNQIHGYIVLCFKNMAKYHVGGKI